jgi:uracil-DNA glycosylase
MVENTEEPAEIELARLSAALRAHVEWLAVTGATGLPASPAESVRASMAPAVVPQATQATQSARGAPAKPNTTPPALGTSSPASAPAGSGPAARAALSPEAREAARVRLSTLAEEVTGCTRCGLHAGRTQTVFARGTPRSGLCFVGEGPGADEDAQGFPFVGKAGQLLDRMIAAMGFDRDDVYVANIVKCRPPNNRKPEPEEMATCMPYLAEQLELVNPEVIVALGATAVQGLLGTSEGITRMRGRWRLYRGKIAVMPTFHPAYLLRTPAAKREVWEDLQAVLRQLGRTVPARR